MWTLQGKRSEMYASIAAHASETAVLIKTKPSRQLFLRLIDQTAVKEITFSPGIAKTIPQKVKTALENAGVKISILSAHAGRPPKFDEKTKKEALVRLENKESAKQISQQLGIPATAVYFWKREQKYGGKKRRSA